MKLKINIYMINGFKNKLINNPEKKKYQLINFTNFLQIFFELNYTQ